MFKLGVAAAAAGAGAALLPRGIAEGADGDPLMLGQANSATSTTTLEANVPGELGVNVENPNGTVALHGTSTDGTGIGGFSENQFGATGFTVNGAAGVHGRGDNQYGRGVFGISEGMFGTGTWGEARGPDGQGVLGLAADDARFGVVGEVLSDGGVGVEGRSVSGVGVSGIVSGPSPKAAGVVGHSPRGAGLHGSTENGVAVQARATGADGVALEAVGPVKLSSAGRAAIPEHARFVDIEAGVPVPKQSAVLTTLEQGNQQVPKRLITHIEKLGGTRFRVHLDGRVAGGFWVNWFVISAFG